MYTVPVIGKSAAGNKESLLKMEIEREQACLLQFSVCMRNKESLLKMEIERDYSKEYIKALIKKQRKSPENGD